MGTEHLSEKQIRYLHYYLPEHLYELQKGHPEDQRLQQLVFDSRFLDDGPRLLGTADFLLKALLLVARISSDNHCYIDLARCVVEYHRRRQKWFSEALAGLRLDPNLVLALASSLTNSTSALGLIIAGLLVSLHRRNHVAITALMARINSMPIEEHDEEMGRLLGVVAVNLSLSGYSSRELLLREKLALRRVRWFLEAVDSGVPSEYARTRYVLLDRCREFVADIPDSTHRAIARKEIGARLELLVSLDAFQETKLLVTEACADRQPVLQLSCLYAGARPFPALAQLILSEINEILQPLLHRAERPPITGDPDFEWYITARTLMQPETVRGNEFWRQETSFFQLSQNCLALIGDVTGILQSRMCRLLTKQFAEQPADSLNRVHGYLLLVRALIDGRTRGEDVTGLLDFAEAELERSATPQARSQPFRGFQMDRSANLPAPSVWFACRAWATAGSLRAALGQADRAERAHRRAAERLKTLETELPNALIEPAIARVTCTVLRARSDIHAVETELANLAQKLPTKLWACCAMTHYDDLRRRGLQLFDEWLGKEPVDKSEEDVPREVLLEILERCLPQGRHDMVSDPHTLEEFTIHPAAVGDVVIMMMRSAFFVKNDDQRSDFVHHALEALAGEGVLDNLNSEQLGAFVDEIGTLVSPKKRAAAVCALSYALAVGRRGGDSLIQGLEILAKDCGGASDAALRGLAVNAAVFQHQEDAARLLVQAAYSRFQEDTVWSEDELLAELCACVEPRLRSKIANKITSHARTCSLSPSAVTRIAGAASRLSRSRHAFIGSTTLGILLSRAEELVSTEQRILVLENIAREIPGRGTASIRAIVACRALWASMASDTAEVRVDLATRIGGLLLESGYATEAKGAICFGIDACIESPWEERAKHILDLYWVGNEYTLAVGKELLSAALTCLEHGRDHAQMTEVLNLLTIALPSVRNPTEDWYKEVVSRVFRLSQQLGESYHFWMQTRYQRGELTVIDWGATAEAQCEKLLRFEEHVLSLHSTDSGDDLASATNLCSASRIVRRNASERWAQSIAQRILRLADQITDTHLDSRSEMIANSASVLACTDPAGAMSFLKQISTAKHRSQLLEAISDGSAKIGDHAVCFETVYLAIQDEAVAIRSMANLTGIISDNAVLDDVVSFLVDDSFGSNDEHTNLESAQQEETSFQTYLALFEPQRRFFLGLADRFPGVLVEVGEDNSPMRARGVAL